MRTCAQVLECASFVISVGHAHGTTAAISGSGSAITVKKIHLHKSWHERNKFDLPQSTGRGETKL